MQLARADIIAGLQSEILRLQGFTKPSGNGKNPVGLDAICDAFPNRTFPLGAVHEFLSGNTEDTAATGGFIIGLLACLMGNQGTTLWISSSRTLFPPALKNFGVQPDRFIFIDLKNERDVLWTMDEALKCAALTAVVGEMSDLSFTASRRLQLAVEKSKVTGFVLRRDENKKSTTACVSRWKITSLPSASFDNLPGIGIPQWKVELSRIRNGKPGSWTLQWKNGTFMLASAASSPEEDLYFQNPESRIQNRQAG
jgi:protein ImuA